jgi:hypothetical protein
MDMLAELRDDNTWAASAPRPGAALDDLVRRGLRQPEFLIVDGAAGLDKAIAAVWDAVTSLYRTCPAKDIP